MTEFVYQGIYDEGYVIVTRAAKALGVSRGRFYDLAKKYAVKLSERSS